MHRPSPRTVLFFGMAAAAVSATSVRAQASLAEIEARYETKQAEARPEGGSGILPMDAYRELQKWLTKTLETYLAGTPRDDDRVEARLLLVSTLLSVGDADAANARLLELDPARAGMVDLLEAAEWAQRLRHPDRRDAWIEAALTKEAPFAERMEAGLVLMTRLVEPDRAEALFDRELEAAADDERRATVLWYRAVAVREREDRASGDYEAALQHIVETYPATGFGAIARDRLQAMAYEPGKPAVALAGPDLEGKTRKLADLRGSVVLEFFWASWDDRSRRALAEVRALHARYADRGLAIFAVSLDDRREELETFLRERELGWPVLFEPGGFDSPLALRANVEHVPHLVLVDREGLIVEPAMSVHDAREVAHVTSRIETALGGPAEPRDR